VIVEVPDGVLAPAVTVSAAFPAVLNDAGLITALAPAGSPVKLNATVPANPFKNPTVSGKLVVAPGATVREMPSSVTVKSAAATTIRLAALAERTTVPLVPVAVIGEVASGVLADVAIVITLLPLPGSVAGLNVATAPVGRPVADRVMVPPKLFAAVAVTV
jgi:hypothetical protein